MVDDAPSQPTLNVSAYAPELSAESPEMQSLLPLEATPNLGNLPVSLGMAKKLLSVRTPLLLLKHVALGLFAEAPEVVVVLILDVIVKSFRSIGSKVAFAVMFPLAF